MVEEVNILQRLQREVQLAARDSETVIQSGDSLHLRNHVARVLHLRPQTRNRKQGQEREREKREIKRQIEQQKRRYEETETRGASLLAYLTMMVMPPTLVYTVFLSAKASHGARTKGGGHDWHYHEFLSVLHDTRSQTKHRAQHGP